MHISNNSFNQYQNIANGLEAATNNKMATTSTETVISDLKQGTIFEGSVSSVENGKVTINLSNGQSIFARLDAGVSIEEGQSLFFEVKNNDGITVQIKPISNGISGNPILLNALNTAGISVNDKSLAMVNTMMQEQLPIGTDSLLAMNRSMLNNPSISPRTLVLLNKYDLPINVGNANMFEAYVTNSARIANDINNLVTGLTDSIAWKNNSPKECITLNKEIIDSFSVIPKNDIITRTTDIVTGTAKLSDMPLETSPANTSIEISVADNNDSNAVMWNNKSELSKMTDDINNLLPSADGTENEYDTNSTLIKAATLRLSGGKIDNILSNKDVISLGDYVDNITKSQAVSDDLVRAGIIDKNGILDKTVTADKFLNNIVNIIEKKQEVVDLNAIKELITSQPYKKILSSFITDNLTMEPQDIIKPAKVNEFFEKVMKDTEEISKIISHISDKTAEVIKESVVNIRENINFMNEANQLYNFVQLPLKMYNQTTDSQLYVFKNKKAQGQQEDDISAFLHFEMEHLGSTDIYVLLNNRDVNCRWYLEDERSLNLINDNIEILNQRLRAKGYNCTMNVTQGQKRADFIEDFLKADITNSASSAIVHRYSFDMRA